MSKELTKKEFERIFEFVKESISLSEADIKKLTKISKAASESIADNYQKFIFYLLIKLAQIDKKIDEYHEALSANSVANIYAIAKKMNLSKEETNELLDDSYKETMWTLEKVIKQKREVKYLKKIFSLNYRNKKKTRGKA